jgi:hypothetical protein
MRATGVYVGGLANDGFDFPTRIGQDTAWNEIGAGDDEV